MCRTQEMMPQTVRRNEVNTVHNVTQITEQRARVGICLLLCFIVPDADRVVKRAGGYEGLLNADRQTSDGLRVEGLRQELKMSVCLLIDRGTNI